MQDALEGAQIGSKRFRELATALEKLDKKIAETTQTAQTTKKDRLGFGKNRRLGNVAAGVGFSALFGGGLGEIIGGGLGGFAGLGGSLIGSVLGRAVDDLIEKAKNVGKALNPLTADIGALATAAGLAGTETERLLKAVEAQVGATAAQALAAEQLAAIVGDSGVKALKDLGEESQKLSNTLSKAFTSLQVAISPLITAINKILSGNVDRTRLVNNVLDQGLYGVKIKPEFQGVQEIIEAVQKFNKRLINEEELQKIATLVALTRELQAESTANLETFRLLFNASSRAVVVAQTNLDIALAQGEAYGEGAAALERQLALQERLSRDAQLRREAESNPEKVAQLANNLAESKLKYERAILEVQRKQQQAVIEAGRRRLELALQYLSIEEQINAASISRIREEARLLADIARLQSEARDAETRAGAATIKGGKLGLDPVAAKRKEIELADYLAVRERERLQIEKNNAIIASNATSNELAAIEEKFRFLNEAQALEYKVNRLNLQIELRRLEIAKERAEANAKGVFEQRRDTLQAQLSNPFGGDQLERELLLLEQRNRRLRETASLVDTIDANERAAADFRADGLNEEAARLEKAVAADRERLALRNAELDQIDQLEQAYQRQQQTLEKYGFVVEGIASGLSDAITALVTGTETVEEAFSRMFANIGKAFIDMATKMLAQQLMLTVLQAFTGGVGVGKGIGGIKGLADGGYVTGPTPALVGEGGEPEYVIPASKMGNAMNRWNAGYRGESIIDGAAAGESGGGGVAVAEAPMSVTINGGVMQMNNEEYIRRDQVPSIIDQASKAGERKALRRLQMSPTTRRKLGM